MAPSYKAKLDRADEHLSAIQDAVKGWSEGDPCELFLDCDVKTREERFRLRVFDPPPADRLDIPISECVHNLRTALDHIGYRLAIYIGGDPPPNADGTGFPICRDPKHFTASLPNRIDKLKRIPPALRTALEDAQLYAGGHGADFPTLTNLNDCDKHRFAPSSLR